MAEGLRKVAHLALVDRVVLLGQQAKVVADRQQALEQGLGVVDPADGDIGVDQPEGADQEGALGGVEAVVDFAGVIPVDEAVVQEVALDGLDRTDVAGIVGGDEAEFGQQQQGGVDRLSALGA